MDNQYTDREIKMAVDMFLGISSGGWEPLITPTSEQPMLVLHYMGKKSRPFKLLYAAVRLPKAMRPTIYFSSFIVDLTTHSITMVNLKADENGSQEDTKRSLLADWAYCLITARNVLKFRDEANEASTVEDPDAKLKKLVKRIARKFHEDGAFRKALKELTAKEKAE